MSRTLRSTALGCTLLASTLAAQSVERGKVLFGSRCAACHGGDGNGGEFAPGIVVRLPNRSDSDIASVITDGLPARGMPAFPMDVQERTGLIAYLRTLQLPRRGAITPAEVDIPTTGGITLHGVSLNRSFEDMQLRTADGRIHLLRKEGARYREVSTQTDWPSYDGQPGGNRYSAMTQVNKGNVGQLVAKWVYSLPGTLSLEVTPIVYQGIMYVTSANECFALDAGSGREIWRYQRQHTKGMEGKVNRGAAVSGERVFMATDNAHLIALNRFTGTLLWETEMADQRQNYFATSAPLIAGNLVVSGIGGGDSGVRGFLAAYDASSGKEVWRFWTIPAAGEAGSETWKGKGISHPGGATWFTGSYDAESKLLYWQVGNPGPDHNGEEREGDNLYSDSVIALDSATGKLKWHYQFTPHDLWDWDAEEPLVLTDAVWQGVHRKLLLHANRNGFFYVLDRIEGQLLLGKPFVKKLTWAKGIAPNGRPELNADQEPTAKGNKVCPALLGATNWWSASFDAASGLFFVQTTESCGIYVKSPVEWEAGRSFTGGSQRIAPSDPSTQSVQAIDIKTGKIAWALPEVGSGESRAGTMSTAGGLVFFGDDTGALMAVDIGNGRPLWQFQTSQALRASPMTYMFDNRQIVAIASGPNILAFALPARD